MDQTTENFLRIEAIFNEVLESSADAREQLIESRCEGDSELATEVHSLLAACEAEEYESASSHLDSNAGPRITAAFRRIGPYLLDRLLGRGGMGAVYLAHRADGQFEQQVAIKLIDLPLATDTFRERFRQERQILAELQHPYIARLLDGGVSQDGELYLVLEYVDGVPIHLFCEQQNLSLPQRLALFVRVCEAVQYAHHHFIVHRDLKPDNILVTSDGAPRLLDFGTAKLLSPPVRNSSSQRTREGYQSFTPQYASPEQVMGRPITTASDTYSLGVLLYLLLTGTMPYEMKEFSTAEMLRAICEEPPHRPTNEVGSRRVLDPDLQAILMKALRKEPRERYVTADQMASDVQAYLSGQPVAARHGTLVYLGTKFVRRHWLGLASAALLAATLVAGIVGVVWQASVANEERRKAVARSADLRQLSNSLMSELDEAIKQLPGSTGAQNLLVTRVLEHLDRLASDSQGDRQTQLDLVNAYIRLGKIQGDPYEQNLGDPSGALVSIDKAIALAAPMANDGVMDREALRDFALAQESRSEILFGTQRMQDAIVSMRAAIAIYERLIATQDATPALISEVASAYSALGDELGQSEPASLNNFPDALTAYRKEMSLINMAMSLDAELKGGKRDLAVGEMKIGDLEMENDPAAALKDYQIAFQRTYALPKAEQDGLQIARLRGLILSREATSMVQFGQYVKATQLSNQDIQFQKNLVAADPQDWRALADLENALNQEAAGFEAEANAALASSPGDRRRSLAAAEKLLTQVVAMMELGLRHDPSNDSWRAVQADAQVRLGAIQSVLHDPSEPGMLAKKGIATFRDLVNKNQVSPKTLDQAGNALLKAEPSSLRDPHFAVSCAERAAVLTHRKTPSILLTMAQAYRADGQVGKSRATAEEALSLLPVQQPGSVKSNIRKLLENLAQAWR